MNGTGVMKKNMKKKRSLKVLSEIKIDKERITKTNTLLAKYEKV